MTSAKLPRRGPWIALASAGFLAALAWVVHPRVQRWRSMSRAEEELSALGSCLVGAADASTADDAELRRRAIGASLSREDWPGRCSAPAAAAEVALTVAQGEPTCQGDARCEALAQTRGLLANLREALAARRFEGGTVAALFVQARGLGMRIETHERPLPKPAEPVAMAAPLYTGGAAERLLDPPFGRELRLLLHEPPRRARLCVLRAKEARCWPLPPTLPLSEVLTMPSAAEGAPPMVLATTSLHDIARGTRIDLNGADVQAHVARDGGIVAVARDDGAWWWRTGAERRRLPALDDARLVMLMGDRLLWLDGDALMELADGAPRSLGTITVDKPTLQSCVTPSMAMLLVTSPPRGHETRAMLAFGSHVMSATVPSRWFGFTCHDDHADLTWIEPESEERTPAGSAVGSYRVSRMRCRRAGCKREDALVSLERHRRASRYFAASLGDALAILWRSPLGDVRLRVAPPKELPQSPERTLFDDAEHGGFEFDDGNTELFVRGETGYLLVEREGADRKRALHALSIDARGVVVPLGQRQ